jgi:hypothetical protein
MTGCGASSDDSTGTEPAPTTVTTTGGTTAEAPTSTSGSGETSGTTDGSGGSSAAEATSTGETATGAETSTGGTTTGGETTTGGCISCGASFMGMDGELCEASQALLDALFECVCGACADVCEGTCTSGAPPSQECQTCQNAAFTGACGRALQACMMDV